MYIYRDSKFLDEIKNTLEDIRDILFNLIFPIGFFTLFIGISFTFYYEIYQVIMTALIKGLILLMVTIYISIVYFKIRKRINLLIQKIRNKEQEIIKETEGFSE